MLFLELVVPSVSGHSLVTTFKLIRKYMSFSEKRGRAYKVEVRMMTSRFIPGKMEKETLLLKLLNSYGNKSKTTLKAFETSKTKLQIDDCAYTFS